ncbi:cell envelope protein [Pseudomonas protegens]|nr:cell envelope protein [Pseudomonas protegens]
MIIKVVMPSLLGVLTLALSGPSLGAFSATAEQARGIAKQAYLYGFPVVEMYKTLYTQAVDQGGPNFKAPFNRIGGTAQVFSPKDTAFVTPNSDTPYSFAWLDLRAEPQVLSLPAIDAQRYYSVQLIDLYTQNFDYLGTRSSGNQGGHYLIAGPDWQGPTPAGIDKVLHSESNIVYALYRTQLFDEKDLEQVQKIQQSYQVQALARFLGRPPPPAPAAIHWPPPTATMSDSPELFGYLNFMLAFAQPQPEEKDLLARLASIGIIPGQPFPLKELGSAQKQALEDGISDGKAEFAAFKKEQVDTHKITSGDLFGSRQHLQDNYLYRYAGANMGIFGNSAEEASYIGYFVDDQGQPLNAGQHRYRLHFAKGQLPPANAFWSLTMYDGKSKLLVANPLQRYLINSRMLPSLKTDADGGLTLHVQHQPPAKELQSNWLPAPDGPFYGVLRIYLPKPDVSNGQWKMPPLTPVAPEQQ